jgi:hypothetical protein
VRLLPKQIWKEKYNYQSNKSVVELKSDIQQLFEKSKGWDFSVNLTGEFTSDFKFKMTPKWQFAYIKNFEREISYLNGELRQDEFNKTRVTFTVRPNSIFLIFFIAFPLIGLLALTSNVTNEQKNDTLVVGLVFIIIVPLLNLLMGHYAKKSIKDRFVKTFKLKEVN